MGDVRATGDVHSIYVQNLEVCFLDQSLTKCVISDLNSSICSALRHVLVSQHMFKTLLCLSKCLGLHIQKM